MKQLPPASQPLDFSTYQKSLGLLSVLRQAIGQPSKSVLALGTFVALLFGLILLTIGTTSKNWHEFIVISGIFMGLPFVYISQMFARHLRYTNQAIRLREFAAVNGFVYHPGLTTYSLPGLLFTDRSAQTSFKNAVSGTYHKLLFTLGNVSNITGHGRRRREKWYGVIRIQLDRKVPHALLDSRSNNFLGFSNLPGIRRNQRLHLEGDFNKHFDLYVPKGYERDVLYFITPELMALLIDYGAGFDIELVDNNLFIYSSQPFALENGTGVLRIFQLIDRIGIEVQENTQRYADANIGNRSLNIIAKPGKRLRKSIPWVVIIIVIAYFLFTIIQQF